MPPEPSAARDVLGHRPQSVLYDGEVWNIICECQWETNGHGEDWRAWDDFEDHVMDDVRTAVNLMATEAKVVRL